MPIGYLVTVALVAWCCLFALVPMRFGRTARQVSWVFAFMINELPFVAFYWLLAATLLAAGEGSLATRVGLIALGLAALTAGGLAVLVSRALHTRPAVEQALAEGLGARWRSAMDAGMAGGLRRRPPLARILFGPVFVRRRDVNRVANIPYGDAGRTNLLDVYHHRGRPSGGPVLVYLHGGGFRSGRKNHEARPLLYRLASQGWVCIGANYGLAPAAEFPEQLIDVKKVIAWARGHGHEFGADTEWVFVAGSSAGGHLASLAGLMSDDPSFQPGFEDADTSVAAVVSLYGYYGPIDSSGSRPSTPLAYLRADAPPFFIAHGDLDTYVPVETARSFQARLRGVSSRPVVYAELPGGHHTFDLFHSIRCEAVIDGIEAFARWVRSTNDPRIAVDGSRVDR